MLGCLLEKTGIYLNVTENSLIEFCFAVLFGGFSAVGFTVMKPLRDLLKLIKTSVKLVDAPELKFLARKHCFFVTQGCCSAWTVRL